MATVMMFDYESPFSGEQSSESGAACSPPSGYSLPGKKSLSGLPDFGSDFEFETDEEMEVPPKDVLCKELLENQRPLSGAGEPRRSLSRKDSVEYDRQVSSSEGFEIQAFPFLYPELHIQPAPTSEESLDQIIHCAKAAVKHENKRRQKYNLKKDKKLNKLKLIGIVRAMSQGCLPFHKYYLTLRVEEMTDGNKGQEKSYQAKLILYDPPERPSFGIFRENGETARFAGSDWESDSETQSEENDSDHDSTFDFDSDFDIPDKILCREHVDSYGSYYGVDTDEDKDCDDDDVGECDDDDVGECEDDNDDLKCESEDEEDDMECHGADDDEEKPHSEGIVRSEMTDREMEEYNEQVTCTGGFDVKFYPNSGPDVIQPVRTYGVPLEMLVRHTKAAVKSENKRREKHNDKKLKLIGIVKAMTSACCVIDDFYITLKAKEMEGEEKLSEEDEEKCNWRTKTYEAHVVAYIPYRKAEFVFFREQGQGNPERRDECCAH